MLEAAETLGAEKEKDALNIKVASYDKEVFEHKKAISEQCFTHHPALNRQKNHIGYKIKQTKKKNAKEINELYNSSQFDTNKEKQGIFKESNGLEQNVQELNRKIVAYEQLIKTQNIDLDMYEKTSTKSKQLIHDLESQREK